MSPTLVPAVLMLMGVLNTATAGPNDDGARWLCDNIYKEQPCEGHDGWSEVGQDRCVKYFPERKSFDDAQEHCSSLGGNLVSVHGMVEMMEILCVSLRGSPERHSFWIGLRRSGDSFVYTDGSKFDYQQWAADQPDNFSGNEDCVEANHRDWGWWNDDDCSDLNHYMCAKSV